MKNLAIIPARGGSKRIPKKNIKDFLGYPIIKYSIAAAKKSKCFDEVMVSTDSVEIAKVAKKYGGKIPFMRSEGKSQDKSTLAEVLLEVLNDYKKIGKNFDYICCILPAAPLILPDKISQGLKLLKKKNAQALIPVVAFGYPIQRAFKIKNDRLKMISPVNINKNSQDLPKAYHDAGQFYWLKTENFLKEKKLFANDLMALEIPESQSQDIDVEEDLKIAKLKYKLLSDEN